MAKYEEFKESMNRFTDLDGDNFRACIREEHLDNIYLEWRLNRDHKLCIIQYYPNGKGYTIFKHQES